MTDCFGKEQFICYTVCVFHECLSVCVSTSFSLVFRVEFDCINSYHCPSFFFGEHNAEI